MKLKTFIKWTGNKSRYLKYIKPHIPEDFNIYIEPFLGSGALFLYLQPEKWIINDINKDNIKVWEFVLDDPESIIYIFKEFGKIFKPLSNKDKINFCKEIVSKLQNMKYNIERATMYTLMKFCSYMGEIIINNKFYFKGLEQNIYNNNRYSFLKQSYFDNLQSVSTFLNDTDGQIFNTDYKNILRKAKRGDFIFLDPPYIDNYTHMYNIDQKIDINFIEDLRNELEKLDNKDVKWLMTQADTKDIRKIFKNYEIIEYPVYRIYLNKHVTELIIKNY